MKIKIIVVIIIIIIILVSVKFYNKSKEVIKVKDVIKLSVKEKLNVDLLYPKESHNKKYLIYSNVLKTGIWLLETDSNTSEKIITEQIHNPNYSWSLDDNYISYIIKKEENGLLYYAAKVYDITENNSQQLDEFGRDISAPQWIVKSEDEMLLIYFLDNVLKKHMFKSKIKLDFKKEVKERIAFQKDMNIWSQKIDGTDVKRLSEKGGYNPKSAPNKDLVVYQWYDNLYYTKIDGSSKPIKIGIGLEPVWSNDSSKLLFTVTQDNGHDITGSDIYYYSLNTKKTRQLTNTPDIIELNPSFSSDNKRIYYVNYKTNQIEKIEL